VFPSGINFHQSRRSSSEGGTLTYQAIPIARSSANFPGTP
jgi:hypothetical protein